MSNLCKITEICQMHTSLTNDEIAIIHDVARNLQMISDLAQANVFIDCPTKDGKHAIVVAEASPQTGPSLYNKSVVGLFAYDSYEPAVIRTHRTGKPTIRNRAITQEGKSVKQSVVPIKTQKGKTIGSLIMEQDITTQLEHENQIEKLYQTTEQLSKTLIGITEQESFISDMIQEALFLLDENERIIYTNSNGINLMMEMGNVGDYMGTPIINHFNFLKDIDLQKDDVTFEEINAGRKTFVIKGISLRKNNGAGGILLLIRDLTELREKERQLMVKSTVIKEIHHRVKNNLQTVASLLRLQMRRGVPPEVRALFEESLHRILSIATVHEVLSNTGLDEVEIFQMIKKIGNMLVQSSGWPEKEIRILFEGEAISLKSDRAVSLALIVNELIQNSIEHAFTNRNNGLIKVSIANECGKISLQIIDDGVGIPVQHTEESLGLQIVKTLTEHDLSGSFSLSSFSSGTRAVIEFPQEEEVNG